jgi:CheY-like chemotaxis protein/nitrogen-specific signal transduction histidine kinase
MNQNESDKLGHQQPAARSIQELQNLISQKEGVLRSKSRLIDNMAYQIRTLSNAVIGFSDLLMIEPLSPDLMEYAKEINQAGNGLSSLVNEVLDWARLESGRMQISMAKCSMSELASAIEKVVASIASAKGLTYSVLVSPDVPSFILSDMDRLYKCVVSLAVNAAKSMEHGSLSIEVRSEKKGSIPYVRFSIIDRSNESSPEQIQHLFEPVQQEDANTEILSMLNMGLAVTACLPLTRQLAEALGGMIEISSRPQEGTIFSLVVPAGGTAEIEPMPQEKIICEDKASFGEGQSAADKPDNTLVLLVEDQPSNRTVISLMLESLGAQVDTAEDGQAGVDAAMQKDYGLILMDLRMPRMDGYEAAVAIREKNIKTPLIALSAKVLNEGENKQIASLFDGFLSKPVDSQKLAETLERYLPALCHPTGRDSAKSVTKTGTVFDYET